MAELNFIVLKVNGVDVSHMPRDEAVKMFLVASGEPFFLEVRPKYGNASTITGQSAIQRNNKLTATSKTKTINADVQEHISAKLADLKIATTTTSEHSKSVPTATTAATSNELLLTFKPTLTPTQMLSTETCTPASTPITSAATRANSGASVTSISTQTDEHYFAKEAAELLIEQEHNLFEQCLAPEIDIEEITLRKSDSNERLGLVVCYSGCSNNGSNGNTTNSSNANNNNGALYVSDDNEICTEVYISDIQPDSVAGRDGRLRQGDQILQINGKDIKNKEETESLIAENNNAVTLLVSRYLYTDEDDFNDPSVAELEVEDEDDDEEEEEFYDDNNLAYENCFLPKEYTNVVDELDRVLMAQAAEQATTFQVHSTARTTTQSITSAHTQAESSSNCITNAIICDEAKSVEQSKDVATKTRYNHVDADQPQVEQKQLSNKHVSKKDGVALKASNMAPLANLPSALTSAPTAAQNVHAFYKLATPFTQIDYETEHIYETIPEDSESEPFYCSPYESATYVTAMGSCSSANTVDTLQLEQQQKQRVAQWLGLRAHPSLAITNGTAVTTTALRQSMRSSSGCGRSITHGDSASMARNNKFSTVRSAITTVTNGSSSSGGNGGGSATGTVLAGANNNCTELLLNDEHDNSSSAYNTGGSSNSTTQPMPSVNQSEAFNCVAHDDDVHASVTLTRNNNSKSQRLQSPKDKITSPKHNSPAMNKSTAIVATAAAAPPATQVLRGNSEFECVPSTFMRMFPSTSLEQQQFSPKMYTNEVNLCQTLLLQQHLHRQNVTQQQQQYTPTMPEQMQQQQQLHCPQFTAPNLSQYHFVSSQEVSAAHASALPQTGGGSVLITQKSTPSEETMVWKVKRRQDGTRYIVRRPARNRCLLRDRSMRLNMERVRNNEMTTTTEEDTISEVKTGRYWSKEERKKHIERARERRHLHQQQQQQLDPIDGTAAHAILSTMRISDRTALKLQQQQKRERALQQQQQNLLLQQQQQQQQQQLSQQRPKRLSAARSTPQQHYQLQFNSATPTASNATQQQSITATALPQHANASEMGASSNLADMNLHEPNAHTCSPIAADTAQCKAGTTTAAAVAATAVLAPVYTSNSEQPYDAILGLGVAATGVVNYLSASDASKMQNLLSVTTV